MVARAVRCRGPSGREFRLVVVGGDVIAPEAATREPGLGWLEAEGYPRLSMEVSRHLENANDGLRLGCWPYRAPLDRWNQAAELYPCLGLATSRDADVLFNVAETKLAVAHEPVRDRSLAALGEGFVQLLRGGSQAVAALFQGVRRATGLVFTGVSLAVATYYVGGTATWLWGLRDGMTGAEAQAGIVLILGATVCAAIVRQVGQRLAASGQGGALPGCPGALDHQPVLQMLLGIFRLGTMLQLLALLGFIVW